MYKSSVKILKKFKKYSLVIEPGTITKYGENLNIEKPLESMGKKLLGSGVRGAKKFMKGAEDLYTAEDDLFKMYNYAIERNRLTKAYGKAGVSRTTRQSEC